jgi:hypothetical protein
MCLHFHDVAASYNVPPAGDDAGINPLAAVASLRKDIGITGAIQKLTVAVTR